ncbi:ABC transporter permease [Kineococcus sp. SYSU DK004]|uniref:ABC transporter permease n=1 Tax=Kineococcus sp. SYSU DK004 TaxID=3383125 RepID=UPI003D7CB0E1
MRLPRRRAAARPSTSPAPPPVPRADRFSAGDLLVEATADLSSRPGRLVTTLLGTVVGIAALVLTLGFAQTTALQLSRQFDRFAATQLVAVPAQAQVGAGRSVAAGRLPWDAVERVERLVGVQAAAVVAEVPLAEGATITAVPVNDPSQAPVAPPRLFAASARLLETLEGTVTTGRAFDAGHDRRGDRVALLGARAAERLGVSRVDTQPSVFVDGLAYAVVGIFDGVAARGELLDAVVVPTGAARRDFQLPVPGEVQARVLVDSGAQVGAQAATALAPDEPASVEVRAPAGRSALARDVQADVNVVLLVLSGVVLVAGAVGIAGITTLSVVERTGEIGLRRALGATPRQIAAQFVTESVIVGTVGGLLGSATGVLALLAVSFARGWTPVVDPLVAVGAVALGGLVGLLAGWFPARRASRVEPVVALRGA